MQGIDNLKGSGGGSSTLSGLSDVSLSSPTSGDALVYNGSTWENEALANVATSGSYTDLSNTPSIPTKVSDLNNDSGFTATSWNQIQQSGTKIAEIDINGTTQDVYAPSGGGGFIAVLIISAEPNETVTATKGQVVYTAVETSLGTYEVSVDSIGTWVVSDGTLSESVVVSAQTIYYVRLSNVPDGKTVTPTDDIQIWLNCADIWDKTYTTLSEVLSDSTTLSALMADSNAVDYLVRSTTWVSGITADSSAMSYIGLNNYASNTLLADSTWNTAIQNSTYFESVDNVKAPVMTSNNTPSGVASASSFYNASYAPYKAFDSDNSTSWATATAGKAGDYLDYEFPDFFVPKKIVVSVSYLNTGGSYQVQGYNPDTNSWDTFFTRTMTSTADNYTHIMNNLNNYKKFRWYCNSVNSQQYSTNIRELQFYGRADI